MSFATYVTSHWAVNDSSVYLASLPIVKYFPALMETYVVPPPAASQGKAGNLWLGSAGQITPVHYDFSTREPGMDGLHAVVAGTKIFRLFDPAANLGRIPRRRSWWRWHQGAIDVLDPDLDTHPGFAEAAWDDVELAAGDMLFIPKLWWHHVRTTTPAAAVNFWFQSRASEELKLTVHRLVMEEHLASAAAMVVPRDRLANIVAFYAKSAPPTGDALDRYLAAPARVMALDAFLDIFAAIGADRAGAEADPDLAARLRAHVATWIDAHLSAHLLQ
ncbi:transcription factor jumonji domain-containing protein [Thecamonas trahens ATCC 50062]|uniref:Transcription factor jumonji domain-containing protein n=1 Tax=Thecamonas trahens ATCC 50062 TaxID=461836 RepID=A0A0L0D274_THETB|nr:transcription factor jumonji domain-containing protein [Thecamonas trahens ATCC 50062]KNC46225.1 transcription factor jumonji domain-containing protein [Thecamonas trahens ATCC 50062]|eukprot:XP_013760522.1 transcription factor jumonji domain-containing protein [Thecamonas trahens ATCC 50062]